VNLIIRPDCDGKKEPQWSFMFIWRCVTCYGLGKVTKDTADKAVYRFKSDPSMRGAWKIVGNRK
jgi:hypothetical protein